MATESVDKWPEATRLLAVRVDRVVEQSEEVRGILQQLGIPSRVIQDHTPIQEPGVVMFQIPGDRLKEAMLFLAMRGFADVRAYEASVPGDGGGRPRGV